MLRFGGQPRDHGAVAVEYAFRISDNLIKVLGSTNWQLPRWEVVVERTWEDTRQNGNPRERLPFVRE